MTATSANCWLLKSIRLATFVLVTCCEIATAATRVALVSGDQKNAGKNIADLTLAKLSQDKHYQFVERDEVERILSEQKLSAQTIDATQAIVLGKILSVDLFVVIESGLGTQAVPGIVVFDAHSGIRYWDASLPMELEPACDAVIQGLQKADRKRQRMIDVRTVGIVTVRNADLPRSEDGFCDTVAFLTERSLPRSPDIALLERRRLERINEERSLPGAEDSSGLLASLSLVDLEISRSPEGQGIQAVALVRSSGADSTERIQVAIDDRDAVTLADRLSQKLIEHWSASPVTAPADRKLEAKRFDVEASHHYRHMRLADAIRAEDAAYALDPQNEDFAERLALYLIRNATYLFDPRRLNVMQGGERAWMDVQIDPVVLQTLLAQTRRGVDVNRQVKRFSAHHPPFNWPLSYLCDRLRGFRNASASTARQELDEVLETCRQRSLDYCEGQARKAEADPNQFDFYTSSISGELKIIRSASVDTLQYADCMFTLIRRWLSVTKHWEPRFNKTDGGELLNLLLQDFVCPGSWPWPLDDREYAAKLAPLFAEMQQHDRSIIRLYGELGSIRAGILLKPEDEESLYARFATRYRTLAQSIIESPQPWNPDRARFSAYEAWNAAIPSVPGNNKRDFVSRELNELCQFMFRRHELHYKTIQQALQTVGPRKALELADQAMAVVESPRFKESDSEKARLRGLMKTTEQNILLAHPEFAKSPVRLPWSKATKVFEVSKLGLEDLVGYVFLEEVLYGTCLQFEKDQSFLRLIKISLETKAVDLLAKADLELPASAIPPHLRHQFVPSICADESGIYVATQGAGIVVFPRPGGEPYRIEIAQGLPTSKVGSLAVLKGKLYAGFQDGYLVSYHLAEKRCDVIASSRRKQKLSPFDDGEVFSVPMLVADPKRDRIVFIIGKYLWQMTADGKISPLFDLITAARGRSEPALMGQTIAWSSPLRGDHVLVSNAFHVMDVDLANDRAIKLHEPQDGIFSLNPPHLIAHGSIWSGGSFARLGLAKRNYQTLPSPDASPYQFRPTCLELVNHGKEIMAANAHTMWLFELQETENSSAR